MIAGHRHTARQRVVGLVGEGLRIGDDHHGAAVVAHHVVVFHHHLGIGHHHDAGARWHARHDIAGRGKVHMIIGDHLIVRQLHVAAALLRQIGQIEHQDTAGIVGGGVAHHVGVIAVLDLDAGHVHFGAGVAHDDVLRLAHIDAGIRRALHHRPVDQHVLGTDRIQAIGAVGGFRPAGPFHPEVDQRDAVAALGFHPVAGGILDTQIAHHNIVRRDQQAFAGDFLGGEIKDGLVRPVALDGDAIDIERQTIGERITPGRDMHGVAGLGFDQRGLQLFLGVAARPDVDHLRLRQR